MREEEKTDNFYYQPDDCFEDVTCLELTQHSQSCMKYNQVHLHVSQFILYVQFVYPGRNQAVIVALHS